MSTSVTPSRTGHRTCNRWRRMVHRLDCWPTEARSPTASRLLGVVGECQPSAAADGRERRGRLRRGPAVAGELPDHETVVEIPAALLRFADPVE